MWYRFSRREDDYCIECSDDGIVFKQMRVCHMWNVCVSEGDVDILKKVR